MAYFSTGCKIDIVGGPSFVHASDDLEHLDHWMTSDAGQACCFVSVTGGSIEPGHLGIDYFDHDLLDNY